MKTRLNREPGEKEILLGNEAIARGAIEAGMRVAAAYPGTPSSEVLEALLAEAENFDYYAEWSINEKVAFEMAAGASLTGVRALTAMKGAGLNVIMDMFMTLPYTGIYGGYVAVVADDPGAHYSSNEQDSRVAAQWAKIPCLEPEDQQEASDMTRAAFSISEALELPVMLRSVTRLSHSSGVVEYAHLEENKQSAGFNKHFNQPYRWNVYGPPGAVDKHIWQLGQIPKMEAASNQSSFNTLKKGRSRRGVIAAGLGAAYAREALRDLDQLDEVWFLKCGWVYPLPEMHCRTLLEECDQILVIEEGDSFIETQVRVLAQQQSSAVRISGKSGEVALPAYGELSTALVRSAVARFLGIDLQVDQERMKRKQQAYGLVTPRSSTLCAGCSHLASYWSLMQETQKNRKSIPVINGDIGCYEQAGYGIKGQMPTATNLPVQRHAAKTPYNFLDTLYIMGSGISMAQGEARAGYTDGDIVAVAGDSTFFHTCMPGLLNAVWNGTKVTFVVMDNAWTSMTGHQVCPATGLNPRGAPANKVMIEDVVRSMGVEFVKVVNPYDVSETSGAVAEALVHPGVAVVITRGECMLQVLRREGKKPVRTRVTDACIGCKICLQIGCPGINFQDKKARIDTLLCVDCGLCAQVCPEGAITEENEHDQ